MKTGQAITYQTSGRLLTDKIRPVAQQLMISRFCHCWAIDSPQVAYWLHVQQFPTIGPKVTFQHIFRLHMSLEMATGGPPEG